MSIEIGATANPPGFDEQVIGLAIGEQKRFPVDYPADYSVKELAGTTLHYAVTVKGLKKRVVPALDDEFAKDLGDFETLDALRAAGAGRSAGGGRPRGRARRCATTCCGSWPARVTFEVPDALIEREIERRIEEFVRRLVEQGVDPRQAGHRLAALPRQSARFGAGNGGQRHRARRNCAARADWRGVGRG